MPTDSAIVVAKASGYTSWTAAIYALVQGMDKNDVAMWAGIAIALIGMVLNTSITWHYKRKDYTLKKAELDARLRGDIK